MSETILGESTELSQICYFQLHDDDERYLQTHTDDTHNVLEESADDGDE
jgi:hypothetical protein